MNMLNRNHIDRFAVWVIVVCLVWIAFTVARVLS